MAWWISRSQISSAHSSALLLIVNSGNTAPLCRAWSPIRVPLSTLWCFPSSCAPRIHVLSEFQSWCRHLVAQRTCCSPTKTCMHKVPHSALEPLYQSRFSHCPLSSSISHNCFLSQSPNLACTAVLSGSEGWRCAHDCSWHPAAWPWFPSCRPW